MWTHYLRRISRVVTLSALAALALACGGSGGGSQTDDGTTASPYVADYRVAKESILRSIPATHIDTARTTLHVAYFHTSHGTHVSWGSFGLPTFKAEDTVRFAITNNAATPVAGSLDFHDHYADTAVNPPDLTTVADWDDWIQQARDYLAANPDINVMMWSWCNIAGTEVSAYLSSMQTLIDEYGPDGSRIGTGAGMRATPVHFVFMTGHANGIVGGVNQNLGNGNPKAQATLIRNYCHAHHYYCIDYYSIDTHDMDDHYWEDADDDSYSPSYGGRFYVDWQDDPAHRPGLEWFENRTQPAPDGVVSWGEHNSQHITANRKAFAFWWVLARIAGYS